MYFPRIRSLLGLVILSVLVSTSSFAQQHPPVQDLAIARSLVGLADYFNVLADDSFWNHNEHERNSIEQAAKVIAIKHNLTGVAKGLNALHANTRELNHTVTELRKKIEIIAVPKRQFHPTEFSRTLLSLSQYIRTHIDEHALAPGARTVFERMLMSKDADMPLERILKRSPQPQKELLDHYHAVLFKMFVVVNTGLEAIRMNDWYLIYANLKVARDQQGQREAEANGLVHIPEDESGDYFVGIEKAQSAALQASYVFERTMSDYFQSQPPRVHAYSILSAAQASLKCSDALRVKNSP